MVEAADEEWLTHLLRSGVGFALAFVPLSIAFAIGAVGELAETGGADGLEHARALVRTLAFRFVVAALAIPIGAIALIARRLKRIFSRRKVTQERAQL